MNVQQAAYYLRSADARGKLLRLDTGGILKRFFFCEEALIRGQAGWLAAIAPHQIKMLLPRFVWEDLLVADDLRRRVFELRYPSRLMEIGADAPVVSFSTAHGMRRLQPHILAASRTCSSLPCAMPMSPI